MTFLHYRSADKQEGHMRISDQRYAKDRRALDVATRLIDFEAFCGFEPAQADARKITAVELKARLDRGEDLAILDVREPQEFDLCRLPGSTLVPLGELPSKLSELDSSKEMVVHCRTGKRSLQAIELLRQAGFSGARLVNLEGGIDAWARDVDPSMPRY
jgi:adenylyltransferase/sulfurtransferase